MQNKAAARRYAQAMFEIANEKKILEPVYQDFMMLQGAIEGSEEFRAFLHNPVIPNKQKKEAFKALFGNKVHAELLNFLMLLCDKDRERILADIIESFSEKRDEKLGMISAEVISVVELSKDQIAGITEKVKVMTGKTPQLSFRKDPALIGGFMVRIGDTVIDGTVRRQLERLRDRFSNERAN